MQENTLKDKKKELPELDKQEWKPLDELEEYNNTLKGKWVQQGPYIINTSSKLDYGIYVGVDQMLVGIDKKGNPVIRSKYKG